MHLHLYRNHSLYKNRSSLILLGVPDFASKDIFFLMDLKRGVIPADKNATLPLEKLILYQAIVKILIQFISMGGNKQLNKFIYLRNRSR